MKQLAGIVETRDFTPLDIATLIDHIEVHETERIGQYRIPEMEVTIHWNIPKVDTLLDEIGEVS